MAIVFYTCQVVMMLAVGGLLVVAAPLALLTKWGRQRWLFEWKNTEGTRPPGQAWMAFEIASEGELEQVRPLLNYFLEQTAIYNQQSPQAPRYLELLFASPSVEKKALALAAQFPQTLMVARLPLLTWGSELWGRQSLRRTITAPNIFFCRYDFFPHLLCWALAKKRKAFLVSATLKNKGRGKWGKWYWGQLMQSFVQIFSASEESDRFAALGVDLAKVVAYDFRHTQIMQRVQHKHEVLEKKTCYAPLKNYLECWPYEQRIIIGSAWPPELEILADQELRLALKKGERCLVVAPHQLKASAVQPLVALVEKMLGQGPVVLGPQSSAEEAAAALATRPSVVILTVPGILCELYADFGIVLVGGGFGRSVHSLLEPYWAMADIYCGPKVFRSTEYDFVNQESPSWIHCLNHPRDFYQVEKQNHKDATSHHHESLKRQAAGELIKQNFLLLAQNLLKSLRPPKV